MSLQASRTRLFGLSRELSRAWQDTLALWPDRKSREFDETYMQELFDSVDNAVAAMEDLDKVLKKLHDDCEI